MSRRDSDGSIYGNPTGPMPEVSSRVNPAAASGGPRFLQANHRHGRLQSTNYWDTNLARCGAFFLSICGDRLCVLVPKQFRREVKRELQTARRVQVDLSPCHHGAPGLPPYGYRLIFDDGTQNPFFLAVGPGQFDGVLPESAHGSSVSVEVYGPGPKLLKRFKGTFRRVAAMPELNPAY